MKKKPKKSARKPARRAGKARAAKTRTASATAQKRPARGPGRALPQSKWAVEEETVYEPSTLNLRTRPSQNPSVPDNEDELDTESGDLEGLSRRQVADSESVEELVDEGQDLEGEMIESIEDAPDPDQSEVSVHKAPRKPAPGFKNRNRL